MKIEYSPYSLKPKLMLNAKATCSPRYGALLRIHFADAAIGYADCHPWPELGDETLEKQLSLLRDGQTTSLTQRSLAIARRDAFARLAGTPLLAEVGKIKNHFILTDINKLETILPEVVEGKFSTIKLKCGRLPSQEAQEIRKCSPQLLDFKLKLRLDFNATLSPESFAHFVRVLGPVLHTIEFFEDPVSSDLEQWRRCLALAAGVPLAPDRNAAQLFRELDFLQSGYLVLKPAVCEASEFFPSSSVPVKCGVIFTSYMDHPIGQVSALESAHSFYRVFPETLRQCGLLTHTLYEKNSYSEALRVAETCLVPEQDGPGFGYTTLLEQECWRLLV